MSRKKTSGGSSAKWPAIAGKMTKLIKAAKVLKTVKLLKPIITIGSLGASVFVYSFSLGLWFSVGFVLMILIHELGHVAALRRRGFKASTPIFIPMLGAVIFAPNMGNRDDEAYMGYAGPLVGGAAAVLLLALTVALSHPPELLRVLTYTALFINVFNLIPIRPLDGGRVTQAVGMWFRYVGVLLLLALTLALKSPGLLVVWILVLSDYRMNRFLKAIIAWVIFVAMMLMEWGGIGQQQYLAVNIIDTILGTFFAVFYGAAAIAKIDDGVAIDERPSLTRAAKAAWLARYVALGAFLISAMVISSHYLPPKARP